MPFRLQAKHIFLTYPQCDLDKDVLLTELLALCGPVHCVVGREHHSDGGLHLHASLSFDRRIDISNERYFDLHGFHPSIEKCRSWAASCKYTIKDGDVCFYPEDLDFDELSSEDTIFLSPEAFGCEGDWLRHCIESKLPYGYAQRLWQLSRSDRGDLVTADTDYGEIDSDLLDYDFPGGSVVVVGRSGCGKTSWAIKRCIKPALWVSHIDQLRKFDSDYHKSIIFDDMDFNHLPVTSQIHLVDQDMPRAIHARYGVAHIPAHTPKIFTCNTRPFVYHEAINRRIDFIEI